MSFTIFGVKVYISFLFCVTVAIFIIADKSGLLFLTLCGSLLHEIGHFLALLIIGNPPKEVNMILGGIDVKIESVCNMKKDIFVSLSGPFVNLLLFALFYRLNLRFSAVNLILGGFNLLPLCGLDGATVIKLLFSKKYIGEKIVSVFSVMVAVALIIISVIFAKRIVNSLSLLVLAVYLILSVVLKF